jgi:hypothetical protein
VFLWSLLFGLGLGAFFDVFRVFRLFVRCSAVTVLFQDLFCFLTAALASFLFVFEVNDGTVRLFILGAFLVGSVAFRISVGQLLTCFCKKIKILFRQRSPLPTSHTQTQETENIEE